MSHDPDSPPSKSSLKRDSTARQNLGVELLELTDEQLDALVMDERLRTALKDLRRFPSHGAKYRQAQYVGKLMRDIDVTPFEAALAAKRAMGIRESLTFRDVEQWRARVIAGDDGVEAFLSAHPDSDARELRALARDARRERDMGGNRAFRELFRVIRDALTKSP